MRFCTACGTPVSGTRSYCTYCGAAIRRTPDQALAAAQTGPTAPQATLPEPASPVPSISLPTTWLADFEQRPAPPLRRDPAPFPAPATAPASGRTLLTVAVVAVLIAAGSAAWMAGSSRPRAGRHPTAASGVSPGRPARPLARSARSARPAAPRPSTSTLTPIPSSRRGIVSASRALAQRDDAQQVVGFLDSYFAAVNHREYLEYSSLFERWHHLTRDEFNRGYRTTHDSSAVLVGLSSSQDTLTATVTFTSRQAPSASPNHSSCTNWRIVLYLRRVGGVYLIAPPPSGYHATYHGCG